jgi:dethiobiotin synthetase
MGKAFFVTGIGTEVGKTVTSAFLQLALDADYWKPVQAGDLDFGDRDRVRSWTGLPADRYHPERFRLHTPASPHYAARVDGVDIQLTDFTLPDSGDRPLLVEGAGGLLVPLNEQDTMLDLVRHLDLPVILVSRHYLGSINHTLLSVEVLRGRGCKLCGIIFSGGGNPESARIIEKLSGVPILAELPEMEEVSRDALHSAVASSVREELRQLIR